MQKRRSLATDEQTEDEGRCTHRGALASRASALWPGHCPQSSTSHIPRSPLPLLRSLATLIRMYDHPVQWYDHRAVKLHRGRHLPHFEQVDTIQFITFRLADSIPADRLNIWIARRLAVRESTAAHHRASGISIWIVSIGVLLTKCCTQSWTTTSMRGMESFPWRLPGSLSQWRLIPTMVWGARGCRARWGWMSYLAPLLMALV